MSTTNPNDPGPGAAGIDAHRGGGRLRRWRLALVPVALMTPLALTACGGSGDAAGASSEGSGNGAAQGYGGPGGQGGPDMEGIQEYMSCLQDNGVTLPERGEGGQPPAGADGEMPQPPAGADGEAPEPPADGEMPQPPADGQAPPDGQGGFRGGMFGLDTSDATVQAAMEACSDLQPEMPQGGPGQDGGGPAGQQGQGQQGQGQQEGATTSTTTVTN